MGVGRPKKITKAVADKLEYGFLKGFNITEACDYAEICRDTYYAKLKESKEFSDRMERAKTNLQRRAKINLADAIETGDIGESKYYLERKCKDEFSPKQEIEHSGAMDINNPMASLTTDELRKLIGNG